MPLQRAAYGQMGTDRGFSLRRRRRLGEPGLDLGRRSGSWIRGLSQLRPLGYWQREDSPHLCSRLVQGDAQACEHLIASTLPFAQETKHQVFNPDIAVAE